MKNIGQMFTGVENKKKEKSQRKIIKTNEQ